MGDERIFLQDYWGMQASYLMFLPLVALEGYGYGDPQPVLAERWEHSEDYREWIFFLRKDVKWHDGVPVTAHDIKFTLDLRQHPAISTGVAARSSVEVLDDFTFKVTYKKPTDGLDWWPVYYPKHLLEGLDPKEFWNWEFWVQPVGNGPYRYVRHVPKTMVEVEANPDYYRDKPRIERVVLKFSGTNQLTELLSGNVDALTYVNPIDVLKLKDDPRFRVYYKMWSEFLFAIFWNHNNPLFNDPNIRKALTLAINRRELAQVINYPKDIPIFDVIFTRRQFQRGELPEPLPYDPEWANKLLEEAGWRDTNSDGIRERDGQEFSFTIILRQGGEMEKGVIYIQDQLRHVGIRMEVQPLDRSLFHKRIRLGDFEAAIGRFDNSPVGDIQGYRLFIDEDSPIGYRNLEVVELLTTAQNTMEPNDVDRIYREIMPIFQADLPLTFLFPQVTTHVVHRRIKGLSSNNRQDPVWFMEYLWIEDEEGVAE